MRTIYKYALLFCENNQFEVPKGTRFLHFDIQDGTPCVWADVIVGNPPETRNLAIHGTGHNVGTLSRYIGTVKDGPFVWHLYDKDGLP